MKRLVVVYLGFFSLLAQTLLFRDFLTAFDGNELAIGLFFFSWLLWICVGASLVRVKSWIPNFFATRYETALVFYAPAYLLQSYLLLNARELIGVEPYELFPLGKLIPALVLANAPVSLVTGILFVLACDWMREDETPTSTVFVLESLGSFAGAVFVTTALHLGFTGESVILVALIGLLAVTGIRSALAMRGRVSKHATFCAIAIVLLALTLDLGVANGWRRGENRKEWLRLVPKGSYLKSFTTPQAEYHLGEYSGDVIVTAWNSVVAKYPDREQGAKVAAMVLAEKPTARNILVVGDGGLSICERLSTVKTVKRVVWLNSDVDFTRRLLTAWPERIRLRTRKIDAPGMEINAYLRESRDPLDAVILDVSDLATLSMNRYFTNEFLVSLKRRMTDGGVVAIHVPAGENYMGPELTLLGASIQQTLASAYKHVVLKPGESSWFFACDEAGVLSDDSDVLVRRLKRIAPIASVYPPENLHSLFPADRIDFQMGEYREAVRQMGEALLLNDAERPKAFFHSLLFTIKQLGWINATLPGLRLVMTRLLPCALLLIVLYGACRLLHAFRNERFGGRWFRFGPLTTSFDALFLIFATAIAGMALNVELMFLYQLRFGSLFLSFGLITSLFMIGMFLGGEGTKRLMGRWKGMARWTPAAPGLFFVFLIILSIAPQPSSRLAFIILFTLAGAFTGMAYPLAVARMRQLGRSASTAGSNLALCDHLGGAVAGLTSSLLFLPVLGVRDTLIVAATLTLVVFLHNWLLSGDKTHSLVKGRLNKRITVVGYLMFGILAYILCVKSMWTTEPPIPQPAAEIPAALQAWLGGEVQATVHHASMDDKSVVYHEIKNSSGQRRGYLFQSKDFVSKPVSGFGGPINAWIHVDPSGKLLNFRVTANAETPEYLRKALAAKERYLGSSIFDGTDPDNWVTVSGATITSNALSRLLDAAGRGFAAKVLKRTTPAREGANSLKRWFTPSVVVLAIFILAALVVRFKISRWIRIAFLLATFLVLGVWLNDQYSMEHVQNLLSLRIPAAGAAFLLIVVIPAIVLLLGNVHCGYLCPFGAFQELVHGLLPTQWSTAPSRSLVKLGQGLKYAVLWLLLLALALDVDHSILKGDVLRNVFASGQRAVPVMMLITLVTLWSIPFNRFWCRNLCPTGAFLAILNGIRPLKRWLPKIIPGRCDLGVTSQRQLDCLNCDRCRVTSAPRTSEETIDPTRNLRNVVFILGVISCGALLAYVSISGVIGKSGVPAAPRATTPPTIQVKPLELPPPPGNTRGTKASKRRRRRGNRRWERYNQRPPSPVHDVDIDKIKRMIRQNRLSDHPGEFSRKIPDE